MKKRLFLVLSLLVSQMACPAMRLFVRKVAGSANQVAAPVSGALIRSFHGQSSVSEQNVWSYRELTLEGMKHEDPKLGEILDQVPYDMAVIKMGKWTGFGYSDQRFKRVQEASFILPGKLARIEKTAKWVEEDLSSVERRLQACIKEKHPDTQKKSLWFNTGEAPDVVANALISPWVLIYKALEESEERLREKLKTKKQDVVSVEQARAFVAGEIQQINDFLKK